MLARVFPRCTAATPLDSLSFTGPPDLFTPSGITEVHVSVSFTYDLPYAEWLGLQWSSVAPVRYGGPAYGLAGGEFIPGRYLRPGWVITSRGCPHRCWFCSVWRRQSGGLIELPIRDGWILQDDNILACSAGHIRAVFRMLSSQPHAAVFSGGLDSSLLEFWHVELLRALSCERIYFAYDRPSEWSSLERAASLLWRGGFTRRGHVLGCYLLVGYPGDTIALAEDRCVSVYQLGFTPRLMAYRPDDGIVNPDWGSWFSTWQHPRRLIRNCRRLCGLPFGSRGIVQEKLL